MSGALPKRFKLFRTRATRETKPVPRPYLFNGGVVLQIFPAVGGPAGMAPCGGAVRAWTYPVHFWLRLRSNWVNVGGAASILGTAGSRMRAYTTKEKLRITAGAISALMIVGWLAVAALTLLATP